MVHHQVHHQVHQVQNALTEDVRNKLFYFVELKWNNNMGSIHIYAKRHKLVEKILELSTNYTSFYKRNTLQKEYKIDKIIIKEIKNKNPHIKINTNK